MKDLILGVVIAVIILIPVIYIYRAKKNGTKCIGCPSGGCLGNCSCHSHEDQNHGPSAFSIKIK